MPSRDKMQHRDNNRSAPTSTLPKPKIIVLDTNVLMHDPTSLVRFEENDIFLPAMVLEELDNNKKGPTDVSRNSREVSRFIEALIQHMEKKNPKWKFIDGLPLEQGKGGKKGLGTLYIQTDVQATQAGGRLTEFERSIPDNHIIAAARELKETESQKYTDVVLVTKDINVRIKARSRGIKAEDYTNDLVATDSDEGIYTGMTELPASVFEKMIQTKPPDSEGDTALYQIDTPQGTPLYINQLVTANVDAGVHPSIVVEVGDGNVLIKHWTDYRRKAVYGIVARNPEQSFLMNLLMDDTIHLVSILGNAGAGKTLLTIAASLAMKESGMYNGIIMTRATVPIGEDIGFLPGPEEDKMGAWMGALDDNLEVIAEVLSNESDPAKRLRNKFNGSNGADEGSSGLISKLRKEIQIKAMNFWRGRTFMRKVVIIDEAQNLTPKQMKTLITRAGPGTKIICLGNLGQIDTPYLTETSSGLAYLIERFKGSNGWAHFAHVTLPHVVRSPLAEYAVEVL